MGYGRWGHRYPIRNAQCPIWELGVVAATGFHRGPIRCPGGLSRPRGPIGPPNPVSKSPGGDRDWMWTAELENGFGGEDESCVAGSGAPSPGPQAFDPATYGAQSERATGGLDAPAAVVAHVADPVPGEEVEKEPEGEKQAAGQHCQHDRIAKQTALMECPPPAPFAV